MDNWLNRYYEDDLSWLDDFRKLMAEKSAHDDALFANIGSDILEFLDHVDGLRDQCESPIELSFLNALFKWAPKHGMPIAYIPNDLCEFYHGRPLQSLYIEPQFKLKLSKQYRVDFLLTTESRIDRKVQKLIVECDGHDYHERTKEQARKDKSRDREMTAAGFTIMRFTGSEIHKSAGDCADQVAAYLTRWK